MIASAPRRVAGEDWRDVALWPLAASVVLCVHAGFIALYLAWREPVETVGDDVPTIAIDLIAPEIDQLEQPEVEKPVPPRETTTDAIEPKDEKPTPPQETTPDAIAPAEKLPEKVEPTTSAPLTTMQSMASAPHIDPSWQSLLIKHLQHFKRYPHTARERNEQGVVVLAVKPRPRRPCAVTPHCKRLWVCRSRRRSPGAGRARTADAGFSAEHA